MIRPNDISRVLQGIAIISNRAVLRATPTAKAEILRMSGHISDIMSTIMSVARDMNNYNNNNNNNNNSNSNNNNNNNNNSTSNSNNNNSSSKVIRDRDPLEFPSIAPDIISDFEIKTSESVAKKRSQMKANRVPSSPTERVIGTE